MIISALFGLVLGQSSFAKLEEVPIANIKIQDAFWTPWRERNRLVSVPHALGNLEKYGNLANFDTAAKGLHSGFIGPVFADSDVYKVLEAAAYTLATNPDPELDAKIDAIIARLAAAQQPDGYLDTYYIVNGIDRRLTNLEDNHEMYCAGHLFEAAVAHYQSTGKRTFLDIAIKYADFLAKTFGDGPGQRMGYPGHPEIELALIRLWQATGTKEYYRLAKFFVDNRGTHFFAKEHNTPENQYDGTYWLDDVPIRDHRKIKGHAVRAAYLMSGVTDVASVSEDAGLLRMLRRVWNNTTEKNMYVTGGIGPSASNEGFTEDYDLPNLTAYQETCASVALMMWNHRLNQLYGDARYADVAETSLYNGVLAGVSLDGKHYFYVNPLESTGSHHRSDWFSCACCPPNVARTLSGLGRYIWLKSKDSLYLNLYVGNSMTTDLAAGKVGVSVATEYPWSGHVDLKINETAAQPWNLDLRIPSWADQHAINLSVNGVRQSLQVVRGYAQLTRAWKAGDRVQLDLPLQPRRINASPAVKDDIGKFALARGPIVYAIEQVDQTWPISGLGLSASAPVTSKYEKQLLGGVVSLETTGEAYSTDWKGGLYQAAQAPKSLTVKAIPYYAWDNRAPGAMKVWLPTTPLAPPARGLETQAKVTLSHTSGYSQPEGVHDGTEPKSSGEQPAQLCHFWPRKGSEEWVEYRWDHPVSISTSRVYWFDDTGRGECRLPDGWRLEFWDGSAWQPIQLEQGERYGIDLDRWCSVNFKPVKTSALRLHLQMKSGWAAGVRQWKVADDED